MPPPSSTRRSFLRTGGALLAAATGALAGCPGDGAPTATPTIATFPTATFEFAYDRTAGTVTITHRGGNAIPVDALYVRGDGFADAEPSDMTGPGPWAGDRGDGGRVGVGDAVVVGASPEYTFRVVWEAPNEDRSATLDMGEGPAQ